MAKQHQAIMKTIIYASYLIISLPMLVLLIWSFTGTWPWPNLLPDSLSFRAMGELFGGYSGAMQVLGSSVLLSAAVSFLAIAVSIPAARAIVLYDFFGKNLLRFLILMPVLVPATAFAMGIQIFFLQIGLSDTVLGVIIVHTILCLPYTVRMMTEVTEATGTKLEMQARVLGATPFQVFTNITLPIAMPGIISSVCLAFIVSFSQYFITFLIGGGNVITFTVLMFPYILSGDRTIAAAYGIIFTLVSFLLFILLEKMIKRHYKIDDISFFT